MRPEYVEIIGEIVGRKFPGAFDLPDLRHPDHFDLTGAAEDDVKIPAHVAQPLVERWRVLVPARKDETAVGAELGDRDEPELVLLELARASCRESGDSP